MKNAIIIVHGARTPFKEEVIADLKNYFDKFLYVKSRLSADKVVTKYARDVLVNKTIFAEPSTNVMSVYIDPKILKQDNPDALYFSSKKVLPSVVAGKIIIHHIAWCKNRSIVPVY